MRRERKHSLGRGSCQFRGENQPPARRPRPLGLLRRPGRTFRRATFRRHCDFHGIVPPYHQRTLRHRLFQPACRESYCRRATELCPTPHLGPRFHLSQTLWLAKNQSGDPSGTSLVRFFHSSRTLPHQHYSLREFAPGSTQPSRRLPLYSITTISPSGSHPHYPLPKTGESIPG